MNTETLILSIEARGEIISSNFPAFADAVRNHLSTFNRSLASDDDFDQAEADVKAIASAEGSLTAAKAKCLEDAESLHALFEQIDGLKGELSTARLDLAKQITKRKDELKTEIVEDALKTFDVNPRLARATYLNGLQQAIKGKRTIDSMKTALRIYAVNAQGVLTKTRALLDSFEAAHGKDLIMDRQELEVKRTDDVEAELRRRFEAKKAEDERKRLEAEAATARAEAERARLALAEANKPAAPPVATAKPAPLPEPPKIGSIKVGGTSDTLPFPTSAEFSPVAEWNAFKTAVFTSLGPLKAAKEALTDADNIERAAKFAQGVNAAWNAANAKEVTA